jgi:hydroxymethylglutaryl-CoA reductase
LKQIGAEPLTRNPDKKNPTSRLPGFYKRSIDERLKALQDATGLSDDDLTLLRENRGFDSTDADRMVENAIGVFPLPLGLAVNFRINSRDLLVPMAVEEPSILAAASNAASLLRNDAGIETHSAEPIMIGQIQILDFENLHQTRDRLKAATDELVDLANQQNQRLLKRGGGAKRLTIREFPETAVGPMLILHLEVNVCEAMGANIINTMVEAIAPDVERISGGRVRLRILSNLADKRLVCARGKVSLDALARNGWDGAEVAKGVVEASVMADIDPYRAATHNKGAMNGVDAFLVAAGQDWRAVEAGSHAYAARDGRYRSLSRWVIQDNTLLGIFEIPMQVGVVGGITRSHPVVKVVHKMLGNPSATELGEIAAACGLAQNLAALLALATDGIQFGHMRMHARNIAVEAGALDHEVEHVVGELRQTQSYDVSTATAALLRLRR